MYTPVLLCLAMMPRNPPFTASFRLLFTIYYFATPSSSTYTHTHNNTVRLEYGIPAMHPTPTRSPPRTQGGARPTGGTQAGRQYRTAQDRQEAFLVAFDDPSSNRSLCVQINVRYQPEPLVRRRGAEGLIQSRTRVLLYAHPPDTFPLRTTRSVPFASLPHKSAQ